MLNGFDCVSNTIETEPFNNASSDLWANRCVSIVKDGLFPTEFINCQKYPIRLERGRVLGYAKFFTEEELEAHTVRTEMYCHYGEESISHKHT